jgi:cytidyltransferase-like protein
MKKRKEKKMVRVLTGGAYDILHTGHILALQKIKAMGDYLIVNINPDYRIRQKKGETRPILSEKERSYIVLNLKPVDEVICVKGKTENGTEYVKLVLDKVNPNIYVSSTPNKEVKIYCEGKGIRFIVVPDVRGFDDYHSEDIIRKIKKGGHLPKLKRYRKR